MWSNWRLPRLDSTPAFFSRTAMRWNSCMCPLNCFFTYSAFLHITY